MILKETSNKSRSFAHFFTMKYIENAYISIKNGIKQAFNFLLKMLPKSIFVSEIFYSSFNIEDIDQDQDIVYSYFLTI